MSDHVVETATHVNIICHLTLTPLLLFLSWAWSVACRRVFLHIAGKLWVHPPFGNSLEQTFNIYHTKLESDDKDITSLPQKPGWRRWRRASPRFSSPQRFHRWSALRQWSGSWSCCPSLFQTPCQIHCKTQNLVHRSWRPCRARSRQSAGSGSQSTGLGLQKWDKNYFP